MINDREIILDALMEILEKKQYSHLVMKNVLDKYDFLDKQEKSFIKRICEGTIEQLIRIDFVLDHFSKVKTGKMKPLIRTLLRMSVYQLLFMEVRDAAVCNEAVKLASKRGFSSLKGYVNGVLRAVARNKDTIAYPTKEDLPAYLSITYSMPRWIVDMWLEEFGTEKTEDMLKAFLSEKPLWIRLKQSLSEEEKKKLRQEMEKQGISVHPSKELSYAWRLENAGKIQSIPGFEEGDFYVQDIGAMWAVELSTISEGDFVYDVCAAPGGKSLHAAEKLNGTGHVEARDLTDSKVMLISENIERSKLTNISARKYDATKLDANAIGKADLVIADLPCSGLGVVGKKSDIKYRITKESILETAKLQQKILQKVQSYVKDKGVLLYSTCTVTREENQKNRDWLLANFPFVLEEEKEILPGDGYTDGFYIARFRKKEA